MELFQALIHSKLITEDRVDHLHIHMYNSSGLRQPAAISIRFIVSDNGKPICSVKKIPHNGFYDIDSIINMQQKLEMNPSVSSPKLYAVYHGCESVYLLEEFIDEPNMHDAISLGNVSSALIVPTLKKIFHVVANQEKVSISSIEIQEEIKTWFTAAQLLNIEEEQILILRNKVEKCIDSLYTKSVMTSRDILLKNILLTPTSVCLVDFDLSRKTSFLWIDVLRAQYYCENSFNLEDFNEVLPKVDYRFLKLLFLLSEMDLQSHIFEESYLPSVERKIRSDFLPLFDEIFGTDLEGFDRQMNTIIVQEDLNKSPIVELYWKSGIDTNYNEEQSIKNKLIMDDQWHIYQFEITDDVTEIRIDPSDEPAMFEIRNINIMNEAGQCIRGINVEDLSLSSDISIYDFPDRHLLMSWSNDPQIMINHQELDGCSHIEFELIVTRNLTWFQNEFLNVTEKVELLEMQVLDLEKRNNELVESEMIKGNLIASRDNLISTYNERINLLELEIKMMKGSRSWRWSAPIRYLSTRLNKLYNSVTGMLAILVHKEYNMKLIPIHFLEAVNQKYMWESLGEDPQFLLNGKFPVGWVRISWQSDSDLSSPMKLYLENSFGFQESGSITIGDLQANNSADKFFDFFLDPSAKRLRLDPTIQRIHFNLSNIKMYKISRVHIIHKAIKRYYEHRHLSFASLIGLIKKMYLAYKNSGLKGVWSKAKALTKLSYNEKVIYDTWIKNNEMNEEKILKISHEINLLKYKPIISIVLPVYNVEENWLRKCIESVSNQIYPNWELCIADDASTKHHILRVLTEYNNSDSRIKIVFRKENGHISASSNSALELASGEFVALLDHDDELTLDALYEVVKLLNEFPHADMIYSDEDKISPEGVRHTPFFKPGWSPETLLSQMYTCHLGVYRTNLVKEIGGFRIGFEGSQDYDLVLRLTERTNEIYHIPKVLYHWRTIPESTASGGAVKSYTNDAGLRAVNEALERRDLAGWVESDPEIPNVYISHPRLSYNPLVSIIIPTRDMAILLSNCLSSLFEKTLYTNFEIIIADNGSVHPETHLLFKEWLEIEPLRFFVERIEIPFNFSRVNNIVVQSARGELILFLNNDIEIITPEWLGEMAAQAMRNDIGAVGACLLYPDNTIQHGGIVLGIGGIAGHSHKYFNAAEYGYFSRLRLTSNYSAVTAACLMVRKEVFIEVQGFDEELAVAFNDVDFCLRVMSRGYRNVWLSHVKLYHHESKSRGQEDSPAKIARFQTEIMFMKQRWGDLLINDPYYNKNLTLEHEDFSLGSSYKEEGKHDH